MFPWIHRPRIDPVDLRPFTRLSPDGHGEQLHASQGMPHLQHHMAVAFHDFRDTLTICRRPVRDQGVAVPEILGGVAAVEP